MNSNADSKTILQVAQVVPHTAAEGPGWRFAIWLQGCPLRCPGCCNPEMLPFEGGSKVRIEEIMHQIESTHAKVGDTDQPLEGITLLGGEPFAHAAGAAVLAESVEKLDLSVMIFSGFTLERLQNMADSDVDRLLSRTDILVDGMFEQDNPDTHRRWIGSANQRIHFLTARYQEHEIRWEQPDTLEIRLADGKLSVNGFPATQATGIWKRPGLK